MYSSKPSTAMGKRGFGGGRVTVGLLIRPFSGYFASTVVVSSTSNISDVITVNRQHSMITAFREPWGKRYGSPLHVYLQWALHLPFTQSWTCKDDVRVQHHHYILQWVTLTFAERFRLVFSLSGFTNLSTKITTQREFRFLLFLLLSKNNQRFQSAKIKVNHCLKSIKV